MDPVSLMALAPSLISILTGKATPEQSAAPTWLVAVAVGAGVLVVLLFVALLLMAVRGRK